MPNTSSTCSSCGSVMPAEAVICDICGHDRNLDPQDSLTPPPSMTVEMQPETPPTATRKPARVPAQQAGKKGGKSGKANATEVLFTTPQWIAITVAAFILGAVLAASMLPTGGSTAAVNGEAAQQGMQPDLQRLNSARDAVEANPDNPDALLAYANALHDADMDDQAIVQYKRYLEFVPDNPDARVDLGICYFNQKDYATAISEMEIAVAKHPDHQLGNYNLGIVNLNAGNKDKAREWFEKARDIDPTSPHGINAVQLLKEQF